MAQHPETPKRGNHEPTGWRLILIPFKVPDKAGSVILPDQVKDVEKYGVTVAYVWKQGKQAFHNREHFPEGAWCKEGDWVIIARNAGSIIHIDGVECRYINDDEILGVTDSPELYAKIRGLNFG